MDPTATEAPTLPWYRRLLRRPDLILLLAVLIFALIIRLYNLGVFPDTLVADEADNAQDSLRITYGLTPANGFFGLDWTAQPAFSAYLLGLFFSLFGFSVDVLRMPSALLSALALIPFYLLLRRHLSLAASLLATLLLASSVWYLHFSRSGWNNVHVCLYMLGAMLFLALALEATNPASPHHRRRWLYFGAAGAFCALGLYAYPSGRAIILGALAFFPIALGFYRRHWTRVLLGYVVMGVVAALLFLPQGIYILNNWDFFNGRSKVVALVNSPQYGTDPVGTILQQLVRNARGPWDGTVNNMAQYTPVGEPQLDLVTAALVLLGMVLSIALPSLRKRPENWLWWTMLLVAWFSTQILTVGTPNGARGIGYMPTLIYFAAVSIDLVVHLSSRLPRRVGWLPVGATAALLLLVTLSNVNHYVAWQSTPRTRHDRYLYITVAEFPLWAADVVQRASAGQNNSNVGQWREKYPIADTANPNPP